MKKIVVGKEYYYRGTPKKNTEGFVVVATDGVTVTLTRKGPENTATIEVRQKNFWEFFK